MGLLQNLVEGVASAAGADDTVRSIEKNKSDRQANQHEELEGKTHMILQDVDALHSRRSNLDPKSPTYQKDAAGIDAALTQAQSTLAQLYHPQQNPGALAKLGGFIHSHLSKDQVRRPWEPQDKPNPTFEDQQSKIGAVAYAPKTPAPSLLTPDEQRQAALVEGGLRPRATEPKVEKPEKKTSDERQRDDYEEYKKGEKKPLSFEAWKARETERGRKIGEGAGGGGSTKETATAAMMWSKYGVKPPSKMQVAVEEYMGEHAMTPGTPATPQEKKLAQSLKQVAPKVEELTKFLEDNDLTKEGEGGMFSISAWSERGKVQKAWEEYSHGLPPKDKKLGELIKLAASLKIMGAAPWSSIGRSKYSYEQIVQHLPETTDTPAQLYEKVQFFQTVLEDAKGSIPDYLMEGGQDAPAGPANPYRTGK